jgi:hypothetical protein
MAEVKQVPVINCEDIHELCGAIWQQCAFGQMAENGSFQPIYTDDEALNTCEENAEWAKDHGTGTDYMLARNELKLVQALRELGYNEMVLVEVFW